MASIIPELLGNLPRLEIAGLAYATSVFFYCIGAALVRWL